MNWEDERYVRVYVRDTVTWKLIGWQGRCLLPLLLRKADRSGCVDTDGAGAEGVAALVDIPLDVASPGLDALLARGVVLSRGDVLVFPKFMAAQDAKQSDKMRAAESRARRREHVLADESAGSVTNRDATVTKRDDLSHGVTRGHAASHGVTPSRADPCLAVPNQDPPSGVSRSVKTAAPQQVELLPIGDQVLVRPAKGRKAKVVTEETEAGRQVWAAYEAAYESRYGRLPKRNGWVHADVHKLIKNVGADDAARIAGHYPTTQHAFYVKNAHAFRFVVADYEKLLGEIETGRVVTDTAARANERTASNPGLSYVDELRRQLEREKKERT